MTITAWWNAQTTYLGLRRSSLIVVLVFKIKNYFASLLKNFRDEKFCENDVDFSSKKKKKLNWEQKFKNTANEMRCVVWEFYFDIFILQETFLETSFSVCVDGWNESPYINFTSSIQWRFKISPLLSDLKMLITESGIEPENLYREKGEGGAGLCYRCDAKGKGACKNSSVRVAYFMNRINRI